MATEFVLGPALEIVIEPEPAAIPTPGRRQIAFDDPATAPGGKVFITLLPAAQPGDKLPINIYIFYVNPPSSVPPQAERTPQWFFASKAPNSSVETALADAEGKLTVQVPGVQPGAYFVQTVLEFPSS